MKRILAKTILRWQLPRFLRDAHPFNRLMGQAIELQFGHVTDEAYRLQLDGFYRQIELETIKRDLDFPGKIARLDRPGGYKTDISAIGLHSAAAAPGGKFDLWRRRFGLLRHIGIRSDVIILRQGERIPPHGHHRVVSGFYVLQGRVAIRHYDRVGRVDNGLLVRKVLDTTLEPTGFTTNSEDFQNIHWLQGLAEKSYLFRVTVVDTPSPSHGHGRTTDSRMYIDPTGAADSTGIIAAPFISESQAKQLVMPLQSSASEPSNDSVHHGPADLIAQN